MLCGQAVSNVFDDDMELDSGNGNITLLKGIKGHSDIGLLSLFEHYNICKVSSIAGWPSGHSATDKPDTNQNQVKILKSKRAFITVIMGRDAVPSAARKCP